MLLKFQKFLLIRDYITNKEKEIEAYNANLKVLPEGNYNGRRQTYLRVFQSPTGSDFHHFFNIEEGKIR